MALRLGAGTWVIVVAATGLIAAGLVMLPGAPKLTVLSAGVLCLLCASILCVLRLEKGWQRRRFRRLMNQISQADPLPSVLTLQNGEIVETNAAAEISFGETLSGMMTSILQDYCADPAGIVKHLHQQALSYGTANDKIKNPGRTLHLYVSHVGQGFYSWRLDEAYSESGILGDTFPIPALLIGARNDVLSMNFAAITLLGNNVLGLDQICDNLPFVSGQYHDVHTANDVVPCLAFIDQNDVPEGHRRLFLYPKPDIAADQGNGWAFFEDLPVPLLKLEPDGEIVLINYSARRLLGNPAKPGMMLEDLLEGLGRSIVDWLEDAIAGRGGTHSEFLRLRDDEQEVFIQVALNRVNEPEGARLIAVLNDATELKSLEAQFMQSQKMQAIGQLAGGVAHDFNNLLTAITGHCDLLLLRHDAEETEYADLMQISQNANRAAALVNQLLAFSRKQTLKPKVIEMRETLSDLAHLLNRLVGETVSVSLSHAQDLWAIRADQRQLEQVLMNLVVNARDAMPDGGEIVIETANLVLDQPMERDRAVIAPGRYVRVKVTDEGCGITPGKIQKVFEPFFTTKRTGEGTGLGLSMAYGIIKQTGGFIFVDSQLGCGTTFTLLLPAYDRENIIQEDIVAAPEESHVTGGVVLLVEDEAPVRAFACRALQMRGFTVIEAESGEKALTVLQDANLHIDVFVTDVIMPGIDGPTWVRKALLARPQTTTVFVSGYAEDSFGDKQSRIAHSVFLQKPFSLVELTDVVGQQLHQQRLLISSGLRA